MSFKIIFAGTPEFAVPTLQALIESDNEVVAVYTQPDRPAGRGRHLQASSVKVLAIQQGIPVRQPQTLRDTFVQEQLRELHADLMVVVAYGLILPKAVLESPRLGCINIHPSLLPKWRGAAPIQRSIEAGDTQTGVSIMQMDEGMDTGPILRQMHCELQGDETSAQLHEKLGDIGAELLLKTIEDLKAGVVKPLRQDDQQATYARKIEKSEATIDWHQAASVIANKIRAFNPWPVAQSSFEGNMLRIWEANAYDKPCTALPGTLVNMDHEGFFVATGKGVLKILSVQLPGKKQVSATDFMCGYDNALKPNETAFG